jgi:hypothetical protein
VLKTKDKKANDWGTYSGAATTVAGAGVVASVPNPCKRKQIHEYA